jgi:hypothetical protein
LLPAGILLMIVIGIVLYFKLRPKPPPEFDLDPEPWYFSPMDKLGGNWETKENLKVFTIMDESGIKNQGPPSISCIFLRFCANIRFCLYWDLARYDKLQAIIDNMPGVKLKVTKAYAVHNKALKQGFDTALTNIENRWLTNQKMFATMDWKKADPTGLRGFVRFEYETYAKKFDWNLEDVPFPWFPYLT